MSMFRQIRPGDCVWAAGILVLLCLSLPAFAAKAGGAASDAYSYAELLLDDLEAVPEYELGPKQYLLVIGTFEKVAKKYPKHPKTDRSLFVTGGLYEDLSERSKSVSHRDKAVTLFRSLAARFPNSPYGEKALVSLRGLGEEAPATAVAKAREPAPVRAPAAPVEETGGAIARPAKFSPKASGGVTILREMRHWSQEDYTRVVVELDDATDIRFDRIQNPDRLYFDFVGARLDKPLGPLSMIKVGDGRLRSIRAGQNSRDVARVVFDLEFPARFTTSWLANPPRLVIELRREAPQMLAANPAAPEPDLLAAATAVGEILPTPRDTLARPILEETTSIDLSSAPLETRDDGSRPSVTSEEIIPAFLEQAAEPSPVRERFDPAPVKHATPSKDVLNAGAAPTVGASAVQSTVDLGMKQEEALLAKLEPPPAILNLPPPKPAKASSSGKRNLIRALGLKVGKVVIDPGHGGHDTGTVGAGKLREKDLVNDIAQRLGKLITTRLGSEIIYTRSDDTFIPLRERSRIANRAEADLFISIHANSARQRSVRGIETFYLSLTTDSWAMAVAARENAAAERSVHELESLVAKITRNENISESRELAAKVQSALYRDLSKQTRSLRNRGVRKAPLLALMGAKMPAVLAEVSFLSNASDEKLLKTSAYRDKIAEALYKGIAAYADTLSSITVTEKTATTAGMD
jgi:N-acetylmuramoyl-L-alanine amidase